MLTDKVRPNWTQFRKHGKFLCPVDATPFGTAQGLAGHLKVKHAEAYERIMRGEYIGGRWSLDTQRQGPEREAEAAVNAVQQFNPIEHLRAGGTLVSSTETRPGAIIPPQAATKATVAILNLKEIAHLSVEDLRAVMDSVCAIRTLDDPTRDLQGTGFATEHLQRRIAQGQHAERQEAVA